MSHQHSRGDEQGGLGAGLDFREAAVMETRWMDLGTAIEAEEPPAFEAD